MPGNLIQVGADNKIKIKDNKVVIAGASDSCCCGTLLYSLTPCSPNTGQNGIGIATLPDGSSVGDVVNLGDWCYTIGDQTTGLTLVGDGVPIDPVYGGCSDPACAAGPADPCDCRARVVVVSVTFTTYGTGGGAADKTVTLTATAAGPCTGGSDYACISGTGADILSDTTTGTGTIDYHLQTGIECYLNDEHNAALFKTVTGQAGYVQYYEDSGIGGGPSWFSSSTYDGPGADVSVTCNYGFVDGSASIEWNDGHGNLVTMTVTYYGIGEYP